MDSRVQKGPVKKLQGLPEVLQIAVFDCAGMESDIGVSWQQKTISF